MDSYLQILLAERWLQKREDLEIDSSSIRGWLNKINTSSCPQNSFSKHYDYCSKLAITSAEPTALHVRDADSLQSGSDADHSHRHATAALCPKFRSVEMRPLLSAA
jgi:hypothetical protein